MQASSPLTRYRIQAARRVSMNERANRKYDRTRRSNDARHTVRTLVVRTVGVGREPSERHKHYSVCLLIGYIPLLKV
jgi:hypothetical protein